MDKELTFSTMEIKFIKTQFYLFQVWRLMGKRNEKRWWQINVKWSHDYRRVGARWITTFLIKNNLQINLGNQKYIVITILINFILNPLVMTQLQPLNIFRILGLLLRLLFHFNMNHSKSLSITKIYKFNLKSICKLILISMHFSVCFHQPVFKVFSWIIQKNYWNDKSILKLNYLIISINP